MTEKLELGNCYYKPAFFNMKIDFPIDLEDLNEIPEGAMGLYYHEYIHFIQDISTIYGLTNISTINYYIQACAHYIHKKGDLLFEVPIELENIVDTNDNSDFGLLNFKLKQVYIGSSIKQKSRNIKDFSYHIVDYEYEKDKRIEKIIITFTDLDTDLEKELEFGGNHVCEGMAYLCEQYHYSNILPHAEAYPYLIVQEIVKKDYPKILDDKLLIIAICDISLMSYHPGINFVRILDYLKNDSYFQTTRTTDEIYKKCLEYIKGSHVDINILADTVKNEIKKNFKSKNYDDINEWVDFMFDRIKIIRNEIPSFVIDLVNFGKPNENNFFKLFLRSIGTPLVLNSENYGTIGLPFNFKPKNDNFNPGIFLALSQILKIFIMDKPVPCELKQFCTQSSSSDPNLKIDSNCDIAPWKRAGYSHLCPVGQIWHHWALTKFSPDHKN